MNNENKLGKHAIIKKENLILFCTTVIIFLLHIIHIKDISIFSILDDEYGYWGNAAYLSGINWSDTVSQIPYYSYGYSLLLVPLFCIFDNTINMYKAAVALNSFMVCTSFLLCYSVAKKLMPKVDKYILIGISFLISMYPTYIVYSYIAWSECLLMLIFWILAWCFVGLNVYTKAYKFYIIGILSGFIYFVHQRSLGILIASITVISIMKIFNKINFKQFIRAILPIFLLMIVGNYLKINIQSNLWLNGTGLSINDYSGQISKINQVLSFGGLIKVFKEFIGQLFYLGVASYLIFYFGLYELIQHSGQMIMISIKNKTSNTINDDYKFYVYLFVLIALFLTMAISSVFFIDPIIINEIVFGRYNEMILGPVILLGFLKILEKGTLTNKLFLFVLIVFLILTAITNLIINVSGLSDYQTVDIIGLISLKHPFGIYISAFFGIMVLSLVFVSFSNMNKKITMITLAVISILFFFIGEKKSISLAIQNTETMKILKVTDLITSSEEELPIYFLLNDTDNPTAVEWNGRLIRDRSVVGFYQYVLKDKNIKPVNPEQLNKISGEKFVITTDNIDFSTFLTDCEPCGNDEGSSLFKYK